MNNSFKFENKNNCIDGTNIYAVNLEGLAEAIFKEVKIDGLVFTKKYKFYSSFIEELEFYNEFDPLLYGLILEHLSVFVESHKLYRSDKFINMLYGNINSKYLKPCINWHEYSHGHKIGWIFYMYIRSK